MTSYRFLFFILFCFLVEIPIAQIPQKRESDSSNLGNTKEAAPFTTSSTTDAEQKVMQLGSWTGSIIGEKLHLRFRDNGIHGQVFSGDKFLLSEFSKIPLEGSGSFSLQREAGTMKFEGSFKNGKGAGRFEFVPSKPYQEYMQKEGFSIGDKKQMTCFLENVTPAFLQMLREKGYTKTTDDELILLAAMRVDARYIQSLHTAGYQNIPVDQLIPLKALGVDSVYIIGLRKAGFTKLSIDDIISRKAGGYRVKR